MNENLVLTPANLASYFETKGNEYTNSHGIQIEITDEVCVNFQLWAKGPTSFDLYVEMDAKDFMETFSIKRWGDLETIDETVLWRQYKMGNGYVWANLEYLADADLCFRIMNGKTVIIGEQLQYHDEIAELIADVEGLRAYVRDHIKELYIATESE